LNRVGIYGGTFDPIHIGHLVTAQSVREIRNLDKIIFVPAFLSPHKLDIKASSPKHRINMLKRAIEGVDFFDISDFELKQKNISYTIDTIKELKKLYDEIELLIGYDNIFKFYTWKNPDELLNLVKLVVLKRKSSYPPPYEDKYYNQAEFVQTRGIEISATDIRERVKHGQPINYLVTKEVKEYIFEHNLYKE
jgi:nicotinate-nucleotide adenylyltransferase